MNWATLLTALAAPIARNVFVALGLTVVSYAGLSNVLIGLLASAKSNLGGLAGDVASILALSGVGDGLSIIAGAMIARLAMIPLKRILPA